MPVWQRTPSYPSVPPNLSAVVYFRVHEAPPVTQHIPVMWWTLGAQAAAAGGTPASMAALDALLECLIRTAGLPAKVSILQWATSLRYQVLTQVSLKSRMVALYQHGWL